MEKLPPKKFKAKVDSIETIAKGVKKITFKINDNFNFLVGQYVWAEIPELKIKDPKGNRRAFSIFNLPNNDNKISIVARTSESGYKQELFALNVGDEIYGHGPFGSAFVADYHKDTNLIFIAGGVGIAPFIPIIQNIKSQSLPIKTFLVYLNKDKENTPFVSELKSLKNDNFNYEIVYGDFSWDLVKNSCVNLGKEIKWLIAGPQGLVDQVYLELEKSGISKLNMVFENYYPTLKNNLTKKIIEDQLFVENVFAKAIQNSTNHTVITDVNGIVLYANKAAQDITGYSLEEILGNTPRLWGGMMSHEYYVDFWKKKMSGEPFQGEIMNRRKNGEIYYTVAHIAPILSSDKTIIGFVGTEEDISILKKKEQEIIDKSVELDTFFSTANDLMCIAGIDGYFKRINPKFKEILSYEEKDLLGSVFISFVHPEDVEYTNNIIKKLSQGEKIVSFKNRFHKKDGSYVWLEWNAAPNGEYLYAIARDITEDIKNKEIMEEKNAELEKMNKFMIGRELKMIELKEEINKLKN
ncbi:MAG: PAS domain S-box protein [Candidatus Nomurabacteria bacterium]|nr:PAS domain S-box protein [Candidatus Nomurabacteria bacterium]